MQGRFPTLFAHSKSLMRHFAFLVTFNIFQPSYAVCFSCKVWRICWSSKECFGPIYLDIRKISKGQERPRTKHQKHRDFQENSHRHSFLLLALWIKHASCNFTCSVKPVPLCSLLPFNLPQIEDDQIISSKPTLGQRPRKHKDDHNDRTRKQVYEVYGLVECS